MCIMCVYVYSVRVGCAVGVFVSVGVCRYVGGMCMCCVCVLCMQCVCGVYVCGCGGYVYVWCVYAVCMWCV